MAPLKTYSRNNNSANRSRMDIIHNILTKPIEKKRKPKIKIKALPVSSKNKARLMANNSSPKLLNKEQNSFDKLLNTTNYHQVNFKSSTAIKKQISGNSSLETSSICFRNIVHSPIIKKKNLKKTKVKTDPMEFILRSPILTRSKSKSLSLDSSTNVSKSFVANHLKTLEKSVDESLCIEKVKVNREAKSFQFTLSSDENLSEIPDSVNDSSINVSYDKIFSKTFKRNDAFSSTPLISIANSKALNNTISPIDNVNSNKANDLKCTPRLKKKSGRRSRIMHDICENKELSSNMNCDKENLNKEYGEVQNDCKEITIYDKSGKVDKQLVINLTNLNISSLLLLENERKYNLKKFFNENNTTIHIDTNLLPTVDLTRLNMEILLNKTNVEVTKFQNSLHKASKELKLRQPFINITNIDIETAINDKIKRNCLRNMPRVDITMLNIEKYLNNAQKEIEMKSIEDKSILSEETSEKQFSQKWRPSFAQNADSPLLEQNCSDNSKSFENINKTESILNEDVVEKRLSEKRRTSFRLNADSVLLEQIYCDSNKSNRNIDKTEEKHSSSKFLLFENTYNDNKTELMLTGKTEKQLSQNSDSSVLEQIHNDSNESYQNINKSESIFSEKSVENQSGDNRRLSLRQSVNSIQSVQTLDNIDNSLTNINTIDSYKFNRIDTVDNTEKNWKESYITLRRRQVFLSARRKRKWKRYDTQNSSTFSDQSGNSKVESDNEYEKSDVSSPSFKGFNSNELRKSFERCRNIQDKLLDVELNLSKSSSNSVNKDNISGEINFSTVQEHKSVLVSNYLQEISDVTSMENMSYTVTTNCRNITDISANLFSNDETQVSNKINKTIDSSIIDTSIYESVYQNHQIFSLKQNKRHRISLFKEHTQESCSFSNASHLINSFSDIIENTPIKVTKRRRIYYTPKKYIEIEEPVVKLENISKISKRNGSHNNTSTQNLKNPLNPNEIEIICLDTPVKPNKNNFETRRLSEIVDFTPNTKLAGKSNELPVIDSDTSTPISNKRMSLRRSLKSNQNKIKRLSFENDSKTDAELRKTRTSKISNVNRIVENDFKKSDEKEHTFAMPKLPSMKKRIKSDQDEGELKLKPGKLWRRSLVEIRNSKIGMSQIRSSIFQNNEGDTIGACPNTTPRRLSVRVVPLPTIQDADKRTVLETYAVSCRKSYISDVLQESILEECFENLSLTRDNFALEEEQRDNYLSAVTARDVVLRKCGQTEPLQFEKCYPNSALQHCQKIGEGVYGEVFLYRTPNGGTSVMKVIPIEGDLMVNGERQKKFEEILSEITIAMELSNLRKNTKNNTNSFSELRKVVCVRGKYPERLLELWELYEEARGSENDHPSIFNEKQLYIVLELANGGKDMEAFVFNNAQQAYALVTQIACALAVAESSLEFEHRDLHWGNVLISNLENKDKLSFRLNRKDIAIEAHGIQIAIIDFTLSRITHEGVCIYNDLAMDPELFTASGDYQFELYKLMQKHNGNNWQHFEPYTNILWLHYILDKATSTLRYKYKNSKVHKKFIKDLKELKEEVLQYKSAEEFVLAKLVNV